MITNSARTTRRSRSLRADDFSLFLNVEYEVISTKLVPMSNHSTRQNPKQLPSVRTTTSSDVATNSPSDNSEYTNHTSIMAYRTETILKEQAARQLWTRKFDPWFADEYRQMYDSMAKVHGISHENNVISLKRPEWQQPCDVLPPVHQRPSGQRRQRVLGAFPQTANDAIGWRVLPQQAVELYGNTTAAYHGHPIRKEWKVSTWPLESFH